MEHARELRETARELRETVLYQTPLEIHLHAKSGPKYSLVFRPFMIVPDFHLHEVWTEIFSGFRYFRV